MHILLSLSFNIFYFISLFILKISVPSTYLLNESPAGLALFQVKDNNDLSMTCFQKFQSQQQEIEYGDAVINNELPTLLPEFLNKNLPQNSTLLVLSQPLMQQLKQQSNIQALFNYDCLKLNKKVQGLLPNIINQQLNTGVKYDLNQSQLQLAHNVSRLSIKINSESLDSLILNAINLYDQSEQEINNYVMRLKEWTVWSFPEVQQIVDDTLIFCQVMEIIGGNKLADLNQIKDLITENQYNQLIQSAKFSVGSEISEDDIKQISQLGKLTKELIIQKDKLAAYIDDRMKKLSPNFTETLGSLTAARILAKAGSLRKLAKLPASTIQILGAENALFRALKSKNTRTPKYGIIYTCSALGGMKNDVKGKVARKLACNAAICARYDAFNEQIIDNQLAVSLKSKLQLNQKGNKIVNQQKQFVVKQDLKNQIQNNTEQIQQIQVKKQQEKQQEIKQEIQQEIKQEVQQAQVIQQPIQEQSNKQNEESSQVDKGHRHHHHHGEHHHHHKSE